MRPNNAEYMRKWRLANPGRHAASQKRYREAHPKKVYEINKKYVAQNKEKVRKARRAIYLKNFEKTSELKHERYLRLRKEMGDLIFRSVARANYARDPSVQLTAGARRRASAARACPEWADLEIIGLIYAEAAHRGLQVDHAIPIQSRIVCGLHVHTNLQLLTKAENVRKGNKFPYPAPEKLA